MEEEKKPMETTQQKESQGKIKILQTKGQDDTGLHFKEIITAEKVE